jgi:hypothetical protein
VTLHPDTQTLTRDYLAVAGHGEDDHGALFRPVKNNTTGQLSEAIMPDGIYKLVCAYSAPSCESDRPSRTRFVAA